MSHSSKENKILFWGCFIALITTAFGFIARMFLLGEWAVEFELDGAQSGRLMGMGIWPFAVSIILFSLVIDKIGYKVAMVFAFLGHIIWAIMGVSAYFVSQGGDKETAYQLVYWGSLVLALGNGTVEAFINPVVATLFSKEKTKWLNILHAGWPGGLVIAGIITLFMSGADWYLKVGILAIPAIVYFVILIKCTFPQSERVTSGVSYREMLQEFGILGAGVVGFLVTLQLMDFAGQGGVELTSTQNWTFIGIGAALVILFGLYTRTLGRGLMFFMIIIMVPLATTEIGTDGWIEDILKGVAAEAGFNSGWVLVYTSAIMMVLRFFAGPIVHALKPLPLLAISAIFAIAGLYTLSFSTGMAIFGAATLYGIGKTFFWPTTLGVVAEQTPRGGALTLNAISGIGMLAVGVLGFPFIGVLKEASIQDGLKANEQIVSALPGIVDGEGKLTVLEDKKIYQIIPYHVVNSEKLGALTEGNEEIKEEIKGVQEKQSQGALAKMAYFPIFMLVCYILLIFYFISKGGYKPVNIHGEDAAAAAGGEA